MIQFSFVMFMEHCWYFEYNMKRTHVMLNLNGYGIH